MSRITASRITAPQFAALKSQGEKITMLTAYDFTMAALLDACGFEQQILWRIADDRQFGEDHQVRAAGGGLAQAARDQRGVARDVADGRVDLCQCNLHPLILRTSAHQAFLTSPGRPFPGAVHRAPAWWRWIPSG